MKKTSVLLHHQGRKNPERFQLETEHSQTDGLFLTELSLYVLTQQLVLLLLTPSSSSPQVVFGEGVGTQQVALTSRRQLLCQVVKQLLSHVSMDRQTNQRRVV